ncbi:hypothetical protein LOAG_12958, partial [Loa loa]
LSKQYILFAYSPRQTTNNDAFAYPPPLDNYYSLNAFPVPYLQLNDLSTKRQSTIIKAMTRRLLISHITCSSYN